MVHTLVQGDSYGYDFSSKAVKSFAVDWVGTWAIVTDFGEASTATGALGVSTDEAKMELRITPAESLPIPPGDYFLVVQITNSTINFQQEVMRDPITIDTQGITP